MSSGSLLSGQARGLRLEYSSSNLVNILPGVARSPDDVCTIISTGTITVDLAAEGVNGLTANQSEAANTLYDVWLISKAAGASPAGFFAETGTELSGTHFPSGSDYIQGQTLYLGTIGNISGSSYNDICPFEVNGNGQYREFYYKDTYASYYQIDDVHTTLSGALAITSGSAQTYTINFDGLVPVRAEEIIHNIWCRNDGAVTRAVRIYRNTHHDYVLERVRFLTIPDLERDNGFKSQREVYNYYEPVSGSLTDQWWYDNTGTSAPGLTIHIAGWTFCICGETKI